MKRSRSGALGWRIFRQAEWPRGLGILGLLGAGVGTAMFVLEYVFVTATGDAGGGLARAFAVLFLAIGLVLTAWHAWGGVRLLKERKQ